MMNIQNSRCDCCGSPVSDAQTEYCPHCSYPTRPSTEIAFLESAIQTLKHIIDRGGGQVLIAGFTHISAATLEELNHLATYGGAELRLVELAQITPKAIEGYRKMKTVKGTEMTVPELIYLLETTAQGMRVLNALAWSKVQAAGIIPLSESTIRQVRQVVARGGAELRVSGLVQLNASTLQDFQRVVAHGGTRIGTIGLLRRYHSRLVYLNSLNILQKQVAENARTASIIPVSQQTTEQTGQELKTPEIQRQPIQPPSLAGIPMPPPPVKTTTPLNPSTPLPVMPSPSLNLPGLSPAMPVSPQRVPAPLPIQAIAPQYVPATPPVPLAPRPRRVQGGLKTFIADSKSFFANSIMLVILLGAFLSLMAALIFVVTYPKSTSTLFVVLGTQILFIVFSLVTQRSRYPAVARIYASVFILLIALFGYELYYVLTPGAFKLNVQEITAIAALYTAISFFAFAIYETYHPFGYFGVISLWVADIAATSALGPGSEWYPVTLMLLTLPSLLTVRPSSGTAISGIERLIAGTPEILRKPVRYCMYMLVILCAVSILPLVYISFLPANSPDTSTVMQQLQILPSGIRFSIACMLLLLLIWCSLYLWLTKKQTGKLGLAWLLLACALAFAYSFQLPSVGYALTITGVALLYHSISRFVGSAPRTSSELALHLDQLTLLLICIVPLISILSINTYIIILPFSPYTLLILSMNTALTISIALNRTKAVVGKARVGLETTSTLTNYWPWLLLLAGGLLCLTYSNALSISMIGEPVRSWWFLGLTLSLVAIAVIVRQRSGPTWANPLDIVAVSVALITIASGLQSSQRVTTILLLSFAALFYAVHLYQRQQRWLFLPTCFFIAALLFNMSNFWLIASFAVIAALLGLTISRLSSRIWAAPLYIPALLSAILTGIAGHTQADILTSASWVLLAFVIIVYIVAIGEKQTALVWFTPLLTTWSVIDTLLLNYYHVTLSSNDLFDLLRLPGIVLLCVAVGVSISLAFRGRNAYSRQERLKYVLPLYTAALVTAILTGYYTFQLETTFPSYIHIADTSLILPSMLLLYAMIAVGVALFEHRASWLWLVAAFGIAGICFAVPTSLYIVVGIGTATAIIGVITGMITRYKIASMTPRPDVVDLLIRAARELLQGLQPATTGWGDALKPFTWSWPWYLMTAVAATITGLYPFIVNAFPTNNVVEYCLLGFTVLFYLVALLEKQVGIAFFAIIFGSWSLLDFAGVDATISHSSGQERPLFLVGIALLCILIAVIVGLPRWLARGRAAGQKQRGLTFTLPLYTMTLFAAIVTGIIISVATSSLHDYLPLILLGYAIIAYVVIAFEQQPRWLFIATGFTVWGTVLISQSFFVLGIGIGSALVGMGLKPIFRRRISTSNASGIWQYILPFTWTWPCYATTLVAALSIGLRPTTSGVVLSPVDSLLVFAALIYIIGLVEKQSVILWVAACFALWSAGVSTAKLDLLHLFLDTYGAVILATGMSLFTRRLYPSRRLHYTLPLYALALCTAIFTALSITFSFGGADIAIPIGSTSITDLRDFLPLILLGYAIITYAVIAYERQPRWLFIATGFAVWGTVLISHTSIVLVIGIGAALTGMGIKQLLRHRISPAGASGIWQYILPFTWTWPCYATTLVAALLIGLRPTTSGAVLSPVDSLLVFAALIYIIGLVEKQSVILWVAACFALWSAGVSTAKLDLLHLFLDTYGAVILATGMSLFTRRLYPSRRLHYTLPLYALALCTAIFTALSITSTFGGAGIIGPSSLAPLHGFLPVILLSYAIIAYIVIAYEQQSRWLFIAAGFAVWGIALISRNPLLLGIGIGSALVGMGLKQMIRHGMRNAPAAGTPGAWQSILPAWTWPWYAATITAALSIGLRSSTSGVLLSTVDSLLVFAALTYVIGIVERQSVILWVAACFALWSAGYSAGQNDLLHLFLDTYCTVILAVVIGLSSRRMSPAVEHNQLLRYTLPLYAVALCTTALTGLSGTGINGILLLFDTLLAYVALRSEQQSRLMGVVAIVGVWGTVLVIAAGMGATILLIIGLIAGFIGIVHTWKAPVPTQSVGATLSTVNKTDNL